MQLRVICGIPQPPASPDVAVVGGFGRHEDRGLGLVDSQDDPEPVPRRRSSCGSAHAHSSGRRRHQRGKSRWVRRRARSHQLSGVRQIRQRGGEPQIIRDVAVIVAVVLAVLSRRVGLAVDHRGSMHRGMCFRELGAAWALEGRVVRHRGHAKQLGQRVDDLRTVWVFAQEAAPKGICGATLHQGPRRGHPILATSRTLELDRGRNAAVTAAGQCRREHDAGEPIGLPPIAVADAVAGTINGRFDGICGSGGAVVN